ncbi:carboxymuconolactone decarboxylase family protein [Yersinia nurmii]|uniref:Carboxymuconolactone decarboxylase family protein n=1 Tax=Yersinia nurmii TaxID=685706 RepID=A0AAW7K3Y4_9GAMM|nr:carboxymuconolactone decarboxylase family protein [Yersinia nurmii]MDN0088721.1 carboxymuconolactone decarboxylase family protein [Yersinia nurmii]CNE95149.1 uncharacterized peroxidase-related enzyme [Yersinia nurmii]
MNRLTPYTIKTVSRENRPIFEHVNNELGFIPNLFGVLAHAPKVLNAYTKMSAVNGSASLNQSEREVVKLASATAHECHFCVAGHCAVIDRNDLLAPDIAQALRQGDNLADDRLNAIAAFTRAIIRSRGNVSEPEYQAFLQAGYSMENALEVIFGVSLATLANFANNLAQPPLNVELEPYSWVGSK